MFSAGGIEILTGQGQSETVRIQVAAKGLQHTGQALGTPALAGGDDFSGGETAAGDSRGDVTHRQHQVHLLSFSEVEADLKIGLPHATKQVGPVREGGCCLEVKGKNLLDLGNQVPGPATGRSAGHLQRGAHLLTQAHQCRESIQLLGQRAWAESKNTHGLASGRGAD